MRDFTLGKYCELCEDILDSGYKVFTVQSYLQKRPGSDFVILRHDVDSKPQKALKMAEMESQMGISSTYYFRSTKSVFIPKIIEKVYAKGHEIGYHYEVLSKAQGNFKEAIRLFERELDEFKKICDIDTICMHGSVLSRYDNRTLWNLYDFRDFGIIGEAYLSMGENFHYFSDTGWEWSNKHKMRDIMPFKKDELFVSSTADLTGAIINNKLNNIYLLVHPGNWADSFHNWCHILIENKVFNIGKELLRFMNYHEDRKSY